MLLCSEEEVEGNHSSSAGKIGEKELFYIMSRGFELKEAMKLMVRARFNKILENIKNEEVFQKPEPIVWECANCGFSYIGEKAIDTCPVCKHPQSYFFEKANNY